MGDKVKDFPLIDLPKKLLQTHGNWNSILTSIPSVSKNHADIMCMMLGRLRTIANEKKSKEIAAILFVSEKTIRNHRYNIKKKLDLPKENNSLLKWAILNFK